MKRSLGNFGATRRKGRGLIGREEAVMEMAWWAQMQLDGMEPEVEGQVLTLVCQLARAHAQRDHFAEEAERLKRRLVDVYERIEAFKTAHGFAAYSPFDKLINDNDEPDDRAE